MKTPKGTIDREGVVSFGDASLSVWEESIPSPSGPGDFKARDAWELAFKRQVFARVVQALNRLGWTVAKPPIKPHDVKHYGGRVARLASERHRDCSKGDLRGELKISGRTIKFEMWQGVNTPTRPDHGGRYESDKEACMPYVLHLEMERTRRRIRDYLCSVFSGYEFNPLNRSHEHKPLRITAMDRITANGKGPLEPSVYDSKSADGQRLHNGVRVFFFDYHGRIAAGTAYCDGSMWDIVTGRWDWARKCNNELYVALPENPRKKRNERQRRKRLEGLLANAVKAMDFDRAKVLKGILWPEPEPLFHIIKDGAYFRSNYCGYTDNPIDAGKYTKAELKPYADQIERGELQAVQVIA